MKIRKRAGGCCKNPFAARKDALSALKKMGTALSPQAKAVQHPVRSRFFEMISFFLHSVSANLMVAKKRGNARKTPEIVRFRRFEAMISFLASRYVSRRRKRYKNDKTKYLTVAGCEITVCAVTHDYSVVCPKESNAFFLNL